jgi:hypothetical protein
MDIPCIIAAKRCWDGKRHVWLGGWMTKGPMASPREVYAGPHVLLYMKPVQNPELYLAVSFSTVRTGGSHNFMDVPWD